MSGLFGRGLSAAAAMAAAMGAGTEYLGMMPRGTLPSTSTVTQVKREHPRTKRIKKAQRHARRLRRLGEARR